MKTTKNTYEPPASHFAPIDTEEAVLMEAVENTDFSKQTKNTSEIRAMQEAFKNTTSKRKTISIRLLEHDLSRIQAKALQEGIPYQTLIGAIIHKVANNKIDLQIK